MPQRRRPRQPVSDPGRDEKVSLAPLTAEQAFKALLNTPPPANERAEKNGAAKRVKADTERILYRAERLLHDAQQAANRLNSIGVPDDDGRVAVWDPVRDLKDIVVNCEAVFWTLTGLKTGRRAEYDRWYAEYADEISNDELLDYFRELRNAILKDGWPGPGEIPGNTIISMDPATMEPRSYTYVLAAPEPPPLPTSHRGVGIMGGDLRPLSQAYVGYVSWFYKQAEQFVASLEPGQDPLEGS